MPDLTEAEKKALKEKNRIRKLELEFERAMNEGTQPNPFDLKPTENKAKGGRVGLKDGSKGCGKAKAGRGRAYGRNS